MDDVPTPFEEMGPDQRGDIQRRLDENRCPWCMAELRTTEETPLTRECTQCKGIVVDHPTGELE